MISFIIPTYNAEKTIKRTINSILNQQKNDIDYEIIVVNDGSNDKTEDIVKEFEENKKIKYFYKENSGVADTRNYGVNNSTGDYIIFVDSDDYISNTLLKDIEKYIKQEIDLIKWSPVFVNEAEEELYKDEIIAFEKISGEQGFNFLFGKDKLIDCLWNYAIKREIMLEFPSRTFHEDFAIMPLIILKANTMVSINKYEYYYVQTENSIMRNEDKEKTRQKLQNKLRHYDNIIDKTQKMKLNIITKQNVAIFATNSLLVVMPELDIEDKKWFTKELKSRRIAKNIKVRNIKQLIKRLILEIKY